METRKSFKAIALLMTGAMSLTACSDEEDETPIIEESRNAVCVINNGTWGNNNASLSVIDIDSNKVYNNAFANANGRSLGDTGQDAIRYGSKIYMAVSGSNTIEVIDGKNFKCLRTIQPSEGKPGYPRDLIADGGKVYVSLQDGYVARIDTSSLAIEDSIAVGPNPEEMTIANGYLYATISDGLNYANGYANGKAVSKIDLRTFKETAKISVAVNPTRITSDKSGNVFVLSMGDYTNIPATIQKINANDSVSTFAEATLMTCHGNTLYTINAPINPSSEVRFSKYNTLTGEVLEADFLKDNERPSNPTSISINPQNGEIFIGSYATATDYTSNGHVFRFDTNGTLKANYPVGVGPTAFVY